MSDIAFYCFLVAIAIERVWETFFLWRIVRGEIMERWTLSALSMSHGLIILSCAVEHVFFRHPFNPILSAIGGGFFCIGLLGRIIASKTLGIYHSPHIEIRKNHQLIVRGIYRWSRNPYYVAVICEFIGFPMLLNVYFVYALVLFLYVPLLLYRIVRERYYMACYFGDAFVNYSKCTKAFFSVPKGFSS